MGRDIAEREYSANDYELFNRRIHDQIDILKQVMARPNFGKGETCIGAELEVYLINENNDVSAVNLQLLEMLEDDFQQEGFSTLRLSKFKTPISDIRVILIDKVGILAEFYHQADLAFIGGSFRGSIHNVMEPAVAGLPVLFGPTYHNSREAEILIKEGGGWCCEDENCFYKRIKSLIKNPELYKRASFSSRQVIMKNLGASARTVKEILESE